MASAHDSSLSSPDPLGHSLTKSSPTNKKTAQKPTTPRKALVESDGNTVHHLYLTTPPARKQSSLSPIKSSVKSRGAISPWRIRVTVEAEPENIMPESPSKRLAEKTITTTVPLKSAADPPPPVVKRGRGRPRKSLDGPVTRSGTPKPKAAGRRKPNDDGHNELSEKKRAGILLSPKKARGRPRKSIGSSPAITGGGDMDAQSEVVDTPPGSPGYTKAETSRKRTAPDSGSPFTAANDGSTFTESIPTRPTSARGRPAKRRSLEKREDAGDSNSPKEPDIVDNDAFLHNPHDPSAQDSALAEADEKMWRSMIHQDSFQPTDYTTTEGKNNTITQKDEEMTGHDPTDKHQEFDSILESEGFSMVSVSSLPSARQQSGDLTHQVGNHKVESTNNSLLAQVSNVVQATGANKVKGSTSSMSPPPILPTRPDPSPRPMANPSSTHVFDGFGAGTRRELRAGLRLGEELAKRQQSIQGEKAKERVEDDVFTSNTQPCYPRLPNSTAPGYSLKMPGAEQGVHYPVLQNPQLPSPVGSTVNDEDEMSWKASSPVTTEPQLPIRGSPALEGQSGKEPTEVQTTPYEVRWQREREAVSKQIEEANTSQVIVIESDDEDTPDSAREDDSDVKQEVDEEEEDDVDIWQEEANSSKSLPESSLQVANGLFQTEAPKPRRSKLPNTWRRGSQIVYSDEIEQPAEPNVITQPNKDVIKAVHQGEVAKQQMHNDGASTSVSTPTEVNLTKSTGNGRQTRTSRVRIHDEYRAVERPGWRSVKGRLQTPLKKTLKNVLSQQYEEEDSQDVRDEDEEILDKDQDGTSKVAATPNVSSTNPDAAVDARIPQEDTTMSYEESIELGSGDESSYMSLAQTPPGSPPQHLLSLYHPRPPQTSSSWLSGLTTYIPTIRTPASTPVPNASNLDPARWNLEPYPPLYTHLPWEYSHWRVLRAYFQIQFAKPGTYPFNPYSPSAKLLSMPIYARNNYGWVRYVSKSDCGLVDKVMEALRVKGVERRPGVWSTGDGARIDELEVAKKMFDMWQDEVHHASCPIGEGNSIGNVPCTKIPLTPSKFKRPVMRKREVPIVP